MSGSMDFSNHAPEQSGQMHHTNLSRPRRSWSNGTADNSFLTGSLSRGPRGSLSFSENNNSMREDVSRHNRPEVLDKDVWGTRVLLSALEDISFTDRPFSKFSPRLIQSLRKLILSVNAATSNCNPFVEFEKPRGVLSGSSRVDDTPRNDHITSEIDISGEIMEELENLAPEIKIIIRSLVTTYVRNVASKIVEKWQPVLNLYNEKEKEALEAGKTTKNSLVNGAKAKTTEASDPNLNESLSVIITTMKSIQARSQELDSEVREAISKRDEEIFKFDRDTKQFKEFTLALLKEKCVQKDPDFVKRYLEYLDLENKCVTEQSSLEKLKQEAEENPENEQEATDKLFNNLKAEYESMLVQTQDVEERISQCKLLGSDYIKIVQEYENIDEEIKTKEWVKEQLQNGPKDDSLFDDSFNE